MHVSIIQFPGTNCEYDTQYAFEKLGATTSIVWYKESTLPQSDLVVIAGGFSYGDYLRSGAIASKSSIASALHAYVNAGKNVLGICNGFQVLTEMHLLPGALMRNSSLHFISKHHHLRPVHTNNSFLQHTSPDETLNIPIAHHDGNYFIDEDGLASLQDNEQILLQYCNADGSLANPNGSTMSIAGICNKEKNVFGLMPHPERAIESILGSDDGVRMLQGFFDS